MTENNIYNEPYCVKNGCLYETVERKGKVTTVRLCDYAPVLKSEITFDDGSECRKAFEIGAVHSNGTTMPTVAVTADEMSSMKWLIEKWGSLGSYSPANNMLAAINDIEDSTLFKLREMVIDEVRRINGIINFESAVRYQRSEED